MRWFLFSVWLLAACEDAEVLKTAVPTARLSETAINFGLVEEGDRETKTIEVANVGGAPLEVKVLMSDDSSQDFLAITSSLEVDAATAKVIEVRFEPTGQGADLGELVIQTNDDLLTEARIELLGGPIYPQLVVDPDRLDFGPLGNEAFSVRLLSIENRGLAKLNIDRLTLDVTGSPDFSLQGTVPGTLQPNATATVELRYLRSARSEVGRLIVTSDDPERPEAIVLLFPDPYPACADRQDNDGDSAIDFPDDPGCSSAMDDDETDPPDCLDGQTTPCGNDTPPCRAGTRTCEGGVFGPCIGFVEGSDETCNGLDDDCDDRTDEEITEACTVFGCSGVRTCVESSTVSTGKFGPCVSANKARETCDGTDENCNGEIDEDVVLDCTVHACEGQISCIPGGTGELTMCLPISSSDEICNGDDDDCTGVADDGIPDQKCGVGECQRTVPGCLNAAIPVCTPGSPSLEVCNGLDDDCVGGVDDGIPDQVCGVGACRQTTPGCLNGTVPACVPGSPSPEICNGVDDNCFGGIDDGIPDQICGAGACRRTAPGCSGGVVPACVPGSPSSEICNGIDDNCVGGVDDGIPDQVCGVGACRRTVAGCSGGVVPACVPGSSSTDICGNGIDEDCSGSDLPCLSCGIPSLAADPQEPNNGATTPSPIVPFPGFLTSNYSYDLTFPVGDASDWFEFQFPPASPSGGFAELSASIACAGWFGAGCGSPATIGLEVWYYDDCFPQQDDTDNGRSGLAFVSSSGPISTLGICGLQRFRVRAYPSTTVCAGEAIQGELQISVTFSE